MLTSPIHKAPMLIACIPLMMGIKFGQWFDFSENLLYLFIVVITLLMIMLQFIKTRRRSAVNIFHLSLFIIAFVILGYLRHHQMNVRNDFTAPIKGEFSATILSTPLEKAKSYRIDLLIDSAFTDSRSFAVGVNTISYIEKSTLALALLPGQRIHFSSTLNPPSKAMNPEDFNYKAFLQRKGIFATTYISSKNWQNIDGEVVNIKIAAAKMQHYVVNILKRLPYEEEEIALLSALTVGYKQMIGKDQHQAYVASGATHILAVSGLHVGIIFLFLTRLFKIFGKSRKVVIARLFIIISLLWCFAFITGLTPSVTRATLMFSLVSIGTVGRQRSSIFNTVFLSAFILLFSKPNLLFDIGFQLSYSAVLGIIAFQPYFSQILSSKLHLPNFLAELMAVSIAAQLGTAPISIHAFNCFPNYFILTNVWIIPLVGLIVNAAITLILVAIIGGSTTWIALPLGWLLKGMNTGVEYISRLPHSITDFIYIDSITMVLLYAAIIMLIIALDYHSKRYLQTFLSLLIITLIFNLYQLEHRKNDEQLFVFNDRNTFNIAARQGFRSNLLIEQDCEMTMPTYFIHHYLAKSTLNATHLSPHYENFNLKINRNFIITPRHLHAVYSDKLAAYSKPIKVSTLILNNEEPRSIYQLYKHVEFKTLVIHHRPEKHINYYRNFCSKNGIHLHLIYEDGAYLSGF